MNNFFMTYDNAQCHCLFLKPQTEALEAPQEVVMTDFYFLIHLLRHEMYLPYHYMG